MNESHDIYFEEHKNDLSDWKKQLANNLTNNTFIREELYLITSYWLDNYEEYLSNNKKL